MTNVKGATMTSSTRSAYVTFELDPPRPVELKPPSYHVFGADEYVTEMMVAKVNVMSSWNTGGYTLLDGYPFVSLIDDESVSVPLSYLASVPDWLSEIIAAGTPTDLEHPAS